MPERWECLDGNEAAARVRLRAERGDRHLPDHPGVTDGRARRRLVGGRPAQPVGRSSPDVVEMQSEAGAAGALHGALQTGALATTFTASQGLLLMIPNMFKIAGELTPAVIHVAARTVATHALSIFGDHSDVMHARSDGMGDAGRRLGAGGARLRARRPRGHAALPGAVPALLRRLPHLARDRQDRAARATTTCGRWSATTTCSTTAPAGMTPEHPVVRGTAQNPDVFFQAREASQPVPPRGARHRRGGDGRARRRAPAGATASSTTTARPTPTG